MSARDSLVNTGTVVAAGGYPGQCYATSIRLTAPTAAISAGTVSSGTGALAHVATYTGGNPATVTVDAAGSGYNYTPTCTVISTAGAGATCIVTMVGASPAMTVASIAVTGGNGAYGTGTTYTTCGLGGYGGNGWMASGLMQ
jgi:hypothetical protein